MSLIQLWRYLWALPHTLLGLLFALIVLLTHGRAQVVDGVLELHGRFASWFLRRCIPLKGGALALTLGHVVIGRDEDALAATRAHERVHVRQYEQWGPLFLPAYAVASLWAHFSQTGAYAGNRFERDAFVRAASAKDEASQA
jgi:hypothetical protein